MAIKLIRTDGIQLNDVQHFLGHQKASTTDIYLSEINPTLIHAGEKPDKMDTV
jgi:site-specific recombinase XerD